MLIANIAYENIPKVIAEDLQYFLRKIKKHLYSEYSDTCDIQNNAFIILLEEKFEKI